MPRLLGSLALVAGGVAWIAFGLAYASKRYGDTATLRLLRPAEPLSSTYRDGADTGPYLAAAVALTLVGLALLYGRAAWAAGSWGRASVILFALSTLMLTPWLFPSVAVTGFAGFLCFVLGILTLAITSLRSGLLSRSVAATLIAAAILLLFFNTEDDRALMAIAPGVAFVALGTRSLMSVAR